MSLPNRPQQRRGWILTMFAVSYVLFRIKMRPPSLYGSQLYIVQLPSDSLTIFGIIILCNWPPFPDQMLSYFLIYWIISGKRCVGTWRRFSFESKLNSSNVHFIVHLRIKQQKQPPFYEGLSKCWVQLPLLLSQVRCLLLIRLLVLQLLQQQPEPPSQLLSRSTVGCLTGKWYASLF